MKKFTIFTILLALILILISSEIAITDYIPKIRKKTDPEYLELPQSVNSYNQGAANVLGADIDYSQIPPTENDFQVDSDEMIFDETALDASSEDMFGFASEMDVIQGGNPNPVSNSSSGFNSPSGPVDFEDENFSFFNQTVLLRDDMIKSAGFTGAFLGEESPNGFLFKTIYIDDLYDVNVKKYIIQTNEALLAKVYIFNLGPLTTADEVYKILKVRGSEGLDIELNETNQFGNASFYLNDKRRTGVAFLTVRFGELIYGFSYPKEFHSQVKNLIALIDMEF